MSETHEPETPAPGSERPTTGKYDAIVRQLLAGRDIEFVSADELIAHLDERERVRNEVNAAEDHTIREVQRRLEDRGQ